MFDTFYRLLLHLLDDGLDFLVGYTTRFGWRLDREIAASTFEKSAQIVRIVGRGAYSLSDTLKLDRNFILFHEAYVHPEYVLKTESNAKCTASRRRMLTSASRVRGSTSRTQRYGQRIEFLYEMLAAQTGQPNRPGFPDMRGEGPDCPDLIFSA